MHVRSGKELINLLARVLYEVKERGVSIDVAFKKVCGGKCAKNLNERENLYEIVRNFISDYIKLTCYVGSSKVSNKELARIWLKNINRSVDAGELYCMYSYPKWFVDDLLKLMPYDDVRDLLNSMNKRIWWLRINTLKGSEESVLRNLDMEGVNYVVDEDIPYMVKILYSPKPIRLLNVVKEFKAVPQDKASAAVVEVLKPEVNDAIIDLAAAPGMKTSLIMMLTENRANVVAADLSLRRVINMKYLLKKLGVDLSRVQLLHTDSISANYRPRFNKALLDAPCSNSGAIGKDPSIKITLSKGKVIRYSLLQVKLITKAISLSERVVYSTCSLLPEEGEFVIDKVASFVKLDKSIEWACNGYPVVNFYNKLMRLMPHKHECEGFFISLLIPK